MPKTIMDLVNEKGDRLQKLKDLKREAPPLTEEERAERDALFAEAEELAKLATRAITEGRYSLAWRQYMSNFVDEEDYEISAKQLARLMAEDGTLADERMNRRRAYLLGNAVCGGPSPDGRAMLAFTVDGIDNDL